MQCWFVHVGLEFASTSAAGGDENFISFIFLRFIASITCSLFSAFHCRWIAKAHCDVIACCFFYQRCWRTWCCYTKLNKTVTKIYCYRMINLFITVIGSHNETLIGWGVKYFDLKVLSGGDKSCDKVGDLLTCLLAFSARWRVIYNPIFEIDFPSTKTIFWNEFSVQTDCFGLWTFRTASAQHSPKQSIL